MRKMKKFGRLSAAALVTAWGLAFAGPAAAATVSATFTTHGSSSSRLLVRGDETFDYSVSGTFIGTVTLQKSFNSSDFKTVLTINSASSGRWDVGEGAGRRVWFRMYCSTHTSGSIVTSMSDVSDRTNTWYNKKNVESLQLNDDGLAVPGTLDVTGAATITGALAATGNSTLTLGRTVMAKTLVGTGATALLGVYTSTVIPVTTSYEQVISSGNLILMAGTPSIATTTVVSGATPLTDGTILVLTSTSATGGLIFQDEGTLTGSLLELGAATRTVDQFNTLRLIFNATLGKWLEESFTAN